VTERDDRREKRQRDPNEGVRLLGADEAAEVLERDDIRHRLAQDQPRFGDRPPEPPSEGPRPALRFPLGSDDDPNSIQRPPVVPVERRAETPELSHWAGSAAEEVPQMNRRDPRRGDDTWTESGFEADPRWRDESGHAPAHAPRPPARGQSGGWADPPPTRASRSAPRPGYDEDPAPAGRSVFDGPPPAGSGGRPPGGQPGYGDQYADANADDGYSDVYEDDYGDAYDDEVYDDAYDEQTGDYAPARRGAHGRPTGRAPRRGGSRTPDRDLRSAVLVGVGLLATALVLFALLGPLGGMLVVIPVLGYAAYEYFVAVNEAGFEAPMPVGVAATVGLAIAAYNYGEGAFPLVFVLTVAVSFLWYLVGAGGDRPVANIGVTLLGVGWIGMFGSFAALLLGEPFGNGVAFLLAAVIPTIGYDVGALFVGRSAGSRPLSPASPNKTVEGLLGGMLLAVVVGVVFGLVGVHPFDSIGEGLKLGLVVALVAPLGDLAESLVKRDLGIKDMGSVLPGHGGLLDRFDALLFVLPAVWYLARISDFFLV
jgi:phosphatidate cytidylyltransferase